MLPRNARCARHAAFLSSTAAEKRKRNLAAGYNETKGLKDGHCNRYACQAPLAREWEAIGRRYSMRDHETNTDARLYYCAGCADQFDLADTRNHAECRISVEEREPYVPETKEDAAELADNGRNTGGGKMRRWR